MAMTREKAMKLEERLIARGAKDFGALKDAFELARTAEDHEHGGEIRRLAREHFRTRGSVAMDLYFRSHLFDAPVNFDSYLIYMEKNRNFQKQFYLPRRKQLKQLVDAMQELSEGKLELLAISMPPGVGKALANDTPVLTRKGWKTHGDLVVGDEVVGLNGEFKKVIAVHPKCQLDVLVEFTNGEKIQCHENHEWMIYDRASGKTITKETKYFEHRTLEYGNVPGKRGHRYVLQLPKSTPFVGELKELPLDPYTFGVWLGDGTNKNPTICNAVKDKAIIEKIISNGIVPKWENVHKVTGVHYYGFGFRKNLQNIGSCHSRRTVPKFIPDIYLTADINQRLELLAGIIDTDGTNVGNKYRFTTNEETLLESFLCLLSTFGWHGGVTTYEPSVSSSGIRARKKWYSVVFTPSIKIPCALERKSNCLTSSQRRNAIKSITRVTAKEGNCITVEGDGVYLVGKSMLPTHNSTLALFYITWLAGKHPEKPILTGSHANSFLNGAYGECLRMLDPTGDYLWHDIFPNIGVISTNAKDMLIDIGADRKDGKRFTTLEFSSVGSGNAGKVRAEQLLYCDDLVPDLETALSKDRLDKLWGQYTVDLRQRKIGDCRELHIATRWSVRDVLGRLEQLYGDSGKARFIVMSALNENDESNFDYPIESGFTTKFYHDQRETMDDASWRALFMNQPIEREGLLVSESELRRYFELPDGEPDAIISVCDTKTTGSDYCVMPVAYQYGNNFYIEDVICDNSNLEIVEPRLISACLKNKIQMSCFESNSAGGKIAEKIQTEVKSRGGRTKITTKYTTQNKETKIIVNSPWWKEHCLFKDNSVIKNDKEYKKFLSFLCSYTMAGKNKHDDVPDAMAQLAIYIQTFTMAQVQIMQRPW